MFMPFSMADALNAIWDSVQTKARKKDDLCTRCKHRQADHCGCGAHCMQDVETLRSKKRKVVPCPCMGFLASTMPQA